MINNLIFRFRIYKRDCQIGINITVSVGMSTEYIEMKQQLNLSLMSRIGTAFHLFFDMFKCVFEFRPKICDTKRKYVAALLFQFYTIPSSKSQKLKNFNLHKTIDIECTSVRYFDF